jgi:hypothetical protein
LAVAVALVPPEIDCPMPRASDEENTSTSIIEGRCRSSPCLVASLHITPDESTM